jgi:hypothetical protein
MPFLSIMLGLMSVMALITLQTAVQERERQLEQHVGVELKGVPAEFVPHEMRCTAAGIDWRTLSGVPKTTSHAGVQTLFNDILRGDQPTGSGKLLLDYLHSIVLQNRHLSFSNRQNSVIIWVEPEAIVIAEVVSYIIEYNDWPLRVGMLPIRKDEVIRYDATHR